eukprot:Gb_07530 [translate_table: standard]
MSTTQFDSGQMTSSFVGSSELLAEAWEASQSAYNNNSNFYRNESKGVVFIAFPGSQSVEDLVTDSMFGECEINKGNELFASMKDTNVDPPVPALVHEGFLRRFLRISQGGSDLQSTISNAEKEGKIIVFTGHSLGGAIATLSTLWMLEKRQRQRSPPFCITFGCPLVGDTKLSQAVRRENWSGNFCHVISRHDIVPRILLSPLKSIRSALRALLPFWWKSMITTSTSKCDVNKMPHPLSQDEAQSFVQRVIERASQVVNYASAAAVASANLLLGGMKNVIKHSPYRPFGAYVFCSTSGAACIDNFEATLQMLYFTLQTRETIEHISGACIIEHTQYFKTLEHISHNIGHAGAFSRLVISDASSPYEVGIAMQLEALGVGMENVQARLALQVAGESEHRLNKNSAEQAVKLGKIQSTLAELEWYKMLCADNDQKELAGYYDSFKQQKSNKHFKANVNRLDLAGFWDQTIEMVERHELPEDFQSQNKWINAGTAYRMLVEPLDIANYYRLGKHEDSGHYLAHGRPRRYRVLQKWLEEKERIRKRVPLRRSQPASLTRDSCFWAYFEEARFDLRILKEKQPADPAITAKLKNFEERVMQMIDRYEVSSEIFLKNCSFMKWWETRKEILSAEDRLNSRLYDFMEGDGFKSYTRTLD